MPKIIDPSAEGFVPIKTKDDCEDSRRKEARAQERFRTSFEPTTIYGTIFNRLSDEEPHDIDQLFRENGGAESDRKTKLYYIAHRGKCTGKWTVYRKENAVWLIFSKLESAHNRIHTSPQAEFSPVDNQERTPPNGYATADVDTGFNGTFNPEFSGKRKPYWLEQSVEAENRHGDVVNALHTVLFRQFGIAAYNTREVDLYLTDDHGRLSDIFEIKTDTATSTLYGAIGQLVLHAACIDPPPIRILLLPEELGEVLRRKLDDIGILVRTYCWSESELVCDLASVFRGSMNG